VPATVTVVGDQAFFAGSNQSDGAGGYDPQVDIYATPEPATMSLLAIGGLAMLKRRRRKA
jgi:hypothetical protein